MAANSIDLISRIPYALRPRGIALPLFMGINVAVSVALWLSMGVCALFGLPGGWITGLFSLPPSAGELLHQPWTAVTYMFTHYSPLHLLFNMLWLYWFVALVPQMGGRRLVTVYLAGGFAGASLYLLTAGPSAAPLCGASASVLALMAAAAVTAPDLRVRLFLLGDIRLKWIALVATGITLLGVGGGDGGGQWAHIGGVAAGAAAGLIWRLRARRRRILPGNDLSRLRPVAPPPAEAASTFAAAAEEALSDEERLDILLDRIRLSGYASLSTSERAELDAISARLERMRKITNAKKLDK